MASGSKRDKKAGLKFLQAAEAGDLRSLKSAAKTLGKGRKIAEAIAAAGADVNKVPLLEMAFGSTRMLDYLLEAGADPNIPNDYGRLPIEIAAVRGKREVVEKLYPVTSPIPIVSDWSINDLYRQVKSPVYVLEEEMQSVNMLERLKSKADSAVRRKEYMVSIFLWTYAERRLLDISADRKKMGDEASGKKDYIAAIFFYSSAMIPPYVQAVLYSNRSMCWLRIGDGNEALKDAERAKNLMPWWPKAHYRVGAAFMMLKAYEQAYGAFRDALNLDPTNEDINKAYWEARTRLALWHEAGINI